MNKKSNKKITLEILAAKMDSGFGKSNESTDNKIKQLADKMDKGFEKVDKKVDRVNTKLISEIGSLRFEMRESFDWVHQEFRSVHKEIDEVNINVKRIDKTSFEDTEALADEIVKLKKNDQIQDRRLEKLELKHNPV